MECGLVGLHQYLKLGLDHVVFSDELRGDPSPRGDPNYKKSSFLGIKTTSFWRQRRQKIEKKNVFQEKLVIFEV